jgi:hypothetical protein
MDVAVLAGGRAAASGGMSAPAVGIRLHFGLPPILGCMSGFATRGCIHRRETSFSCARIDIGQEALNLDKKESVLPWCNQTVCVALEHYWQIYWASYWNSPSKRFTVPVNPVTGSNVDP